MSKKAPEAPDPYKVANAQTASNVQTAIANTVMQNADTYGPLGNTIYTQTGTKKMTVPIDEKGHTRTYDIPEYNVKQLLSNDQQHLLDLQEKAGTNLGNLAVSQSAKLNGLLGTSINPAGLPANMVYDAATAGRLRLADSPDDFSKDRDKVQAALMARINPEIDKDRNALLTRLANQGVQSGSSAYNNELGQFGQHVNDARMQAVLGAGQEQNRLYDLALQQASQQNAVIQGDFENALTHQQNQQTLRQQQLQEQIALRNQPISEITSLLSGGAPTMPNFQPFAAGHVSDTPIGQYMYDSAKINSQNSMAANSGMYGLGSTLLGGLFSISDRRAKENIRKVGTLDNGLPIYLYNYKGDPKEHFGPMAQEVEMVNPDAVIEIGGLKYVNYSAAVH